MALTSTFEVKENNLILTEKSIGIEKRVVPVSMKFNVVKGNSLFNQIMTMSGFSQFIEDELNSEFNVDFEGYKPEYVEKLKQEDLKLKEIIRKSQPKITIKIELETYE